MNRKQGTPETCGSSEERAQVQREFFDGRASAWRELPEERVEELLSPLPLCAGGRALDVGCGTGVLEPALLRRGLQVDAVDISPKMIERAVKKPENDGADFFVADYYEWEKDGAYDYILVFDAYPHFTDKHKFAQKAAELLKEGGSIFIFFDSGKQVINGRHGGHSPLLSCGLRGASCEAQVFASRFELLFATDNAQSYRIGLKKR